MPSSAVAGMVFLLSQELFQMVKPMTEIELNEKIENLLTESAPVQSSRRTAVSYTHLDVYKRQVPELSQAHPDSQ